MLIYDYRNKPVHRTGQGLVMLNPRVAKLCTILIFKYCLFLSKKYIEEKR